MPRRSGDENFTTSERNLMKSLIRDYLMFGARGHEIQQDLSARMGREIPEKTVYNLKAEIAKEDGDSSANMWLENFTRGGFVDHFKRRIEEVEYIQKNMLILFSKEVNKEHGQNKYLVNQLAKTITETSKVLAEFGMAPPIIAKIKSMIPLDITHLNDRFEEQKEIATNSYIEGITRLNSPSLENNNDDSTLDNTKSQAGNIPSPKSVYSGNAESAIFPPVNKTVNPNGGTHTETTEAKQQNESQRVF